MSNELLIRGVAALGTPRLSELASRAGVTAGPGEDPTRLAARLLAVLEPADLAHRGLTDADVEVMGRAIGIGARDSWRPRISAEEYDRLPFYQKPSYDQEVWNALLASDAPANASTAKGAKATTAKAATAKGAKAAPTKGAKAPAKAAMAKGAQASTAKAAQASPAKGAKASTAKGAKATPAKGAKAAPAKGVTAKAAPAKGAKAKATPSKSGTAKAANKKVGKPKATRRA